MSNTRFLLTIVAAATLIAAPAYGQRCLQSTLSGGNGGNGNMFDVQAAGQDVVVNGFSQSFLASGGEQIAYEIWAVTGGGSYAGSEQVQGNWTLVGNGSVVANPTGTPTLLPTNVDLQVGAGLTQGFYITTTGVSHLSYTNGSQVGGLASGDNHLAIFEGVAQSYPFGSPLSPRVWNGTVHYSVAGVAPEYQTNSATSSLVINGVETAGCAPATVTTCQTGPLHLEYRTSTTNMGFEFALTNQALTPASSGGTTSALGQVINLDFGGFYWFMFGGSTFEFTPIPGDWNYDFIAPTDAGVMSFQAYQLDPTHPEGFALSQGVQIDTVAPGLVSGPSGDDAFTQVDLGAAPLCWSAGDVEFYGTTHTEFFVSSNGRITFGYGDADFSPTTAEALLDAPFVGAWTDLQPNFGGAISVSASGTTLRVDYSAVPYGGSAGTATFAVLFDSSYDEVHLTGLAGMETGGNCFLGMSPGFSGNATDPGATDWSALGGSVSAPTDMLYEYGTAGTLAQGFDTLRFVPDGAGNYIWLAL